MNSTSEAEFFEQYQRHLFPQSAVPVLSQLGSQSSTNEEHQLHVYSMVIAVEEQRSAFGNAIYKRRRSLYLFRVVFEVNLDQVGKFCDAQVFRPFRNIFLSEERATVSLQELVHFVAQFLVMQGAVTVELVLVEVSKLVINHVALSEISGKVAMLTVI